MISWIHLVNSILTLDDVADERIIALVPFAQRDAAGVFDTSRVEQRGSGILPLSHQLSTFWTSAAYPPLFATIALFKRAGVQKAFNFLGRGGL